MKKILAIAVALCLMISGLVVSASAATSADKIFAGANLNLNEGIAMQFLVYPEAVADYDTTYLSVKYLDRSDNILTKKVEPVDYTFDGVRYILYRFDAVSPDRMADDVTASLYGVKGGVSAQLGDTMTYSVKQYVKNTYSHTTDSDNALYGNAHLQTLLADILYYGEKARLYTLASNIGTNETPIYDPDHDDWKWVDTLRTKGEFADEEGSSVKKLAYSDGVTSSTEHISWTSVGLNLRENPAILYKFKLTNKASGVSNYKLVVEDAEGTVIDSYPLSAEWYDKTERCYTYRFRGLNPTKMGEKVSAYFVNAQGAKVSAVLDYSVESFANFCYTETNGGKNFTATVTKELYELTQALMGYGASTTVYFDEVNDLSTIIVYPEYDQRIERDYTYDVSVVQETPYGDISKELVCYNHCDSVATTERTVNGDMYRRFCEFAFEQDETMPLRVDITVYSDFDSYTVMPSAKNFRSKINGNVISVYLDKPEYFLLKLDDKDDSILAVFADEPETDVPDKNASNVIYIDGWYEPADSTVFTVSTNNTTLYLAPGSVLNARVKITGSNVTVKGRGMILDPYSDIYSTDVSETAGNESKMYLLHITGSNCTVDGIKLVDARTFNLWVQCTGLKVTNFKALSSQMCTDGITSHKKGGNSFKHCFLYVADNALVLSESSTITTYDDITIGTICCGIFPQNNAGLYEISNIYIFRADEGVMRNCYSHNNINTRTFDLTLNNVSAVDCDHFPFIFYGFKVGTGAKKITFNNLSVPAATGTHVLNGTNTGNIIRIENGEIETYNYTLTFNGLSVGGKAVTSASSLKTNMTSGNTVKVTGSGSKFGPATANKKSGSVKPEGKIFIGERQLLVKNRAVKKDGTWYVPAADVCAAVGKSVPSSTTTINGVKYISLANLTSSKVAKSATYDSSTGRIKIGIPTGTTGDLLSWFGNSAHSHWSEYSCYSMHMVWTGSGNSFRMENCAAWAGISYNLTQQFQQYGTGKYTLTFQAKFDSGAKTALRFYINGEEKLYSSKALTTEWQSFTVPFNNVPDPSTVKNACLIFYDTAGNSNIEFKDIKLTYTVS